MSCQSTARARPALRFRAHFGLGQCYYNLMGLRDHPKMAITQWGKAEELRPTNPDVLASLALIDLLSGDMSAARERADRARQEAPRHPVARSVLAQVMGKEEGPLQALTDVYGYKAPGFAPGELDDDDAGAHGTVAHLLAQIGMFGEAMEHAEEAVAVGDGRPDVWKVLGWTRLAAATQRRSSG
ncbi:MAG: hypothetical protein NTW87_36255, partial [Planctomycetota bacterium]|nr:hypothetical protein [Planctomycetota bacterium]